MYVCIYIYIYIYICMYVYIYIYIYMAHKVRGDCWLLYTEYLVIALAQHEGVKCFLLIVRINFENKLRSYERLKHQA